MQYMLLIYHNEQGWADLPKDQLQAMVAAYGAFTQELIASGAMRAGSALRPAATATMVRVRNGKVQTTDGPFAETKEQLGGYYLIDVANVDEAVKWAAKIPSANGGTIEIRPLEENPGT